MTDQKGDIGLIGLAVMGQNLILNMNDHGYRVVAYNRTLSTLEEFLRQAALGTNVIGAHTVEELVRKTKRPRKIMMMIRAGQPVDAMIAELLPHLEKGDILIDGGNSHYVDTQRRVMELEKQGIFFIGCGISGGEEGARHGPSIMPGGNREAWPHVQSLFQAIAARSDEGEPCCDWVGEGGAGHYVKMVHNGIEYGDMQLICEAYHLLSAGLGIQGRELQTIFSRWNRGELSSYLIEITAEIFGFSEPDGSFVVDKILDVAGQKGTGKWTGMSSLDLGMPLTLIAEAVFARCISALKEERIEMSSHFKKPIPSFVGNREEMIEEIRQALYASKIISYVQGFMLMRAAAKEMKWNLQYGAIALMWRGGCIIRSRFLNEIKKAFDRKRDLTSLLLDPFFQKEIRRSESSWRSVVAFSAERGIPTPCFSSALSFFDGYRQEKLPANLLQAQRDFFGAHTYERVDAPRGTFFHTNWTKTGGTTSSSSYSV